MPMLDAHPAPEVTSAGKVYADVARWAAPPGHKPAIQRYSHPFPVLCPEDMLKDSRISCHHPHRAQVHARGRILLALSSTKCGTISHHCVPLFAASSLHYWATLDQAIVGLLFHTGQSEKARSETSTRLGLYVAFYSLVNVPTAKVPAERVCTDCH